MEIVRLKAKDYDEWLWVLNTVFFRQNKRETNFEKELPKMCVRDDHHMGMHFAVKDGGKICSLLGVYPLKTQIGEKELMFSTVGNVATLPGHEGKGYMRMLMNEAMSELERIGADASRLGGARQRYNRYGYEMCGVEYKFSINDFTTKYCFDNKDEILFKETGFNDKKELAFISELRMREPIYVHRSCDDTFWGDFASLCAWQNKPFVAIGKDGEMLGYLTVSESGTDIAEVMAGDLETLKNILFNWQKNVKGQISFVLSPAHSEAVKYFSGVASNMSAASPCLFKIINFDKVADALLKLKASRTSGLQSGEKVIAIRDWGNMLLYNKNGDAFCEKTDRKADILLDKLEAARFLFGPFGPDTVADCEGFLSSILPLPLSWSTLDRV